MAAGVRVVGAAPAQGWKGRGVAAHGAPPVREALAAGQARHVPGAAELAAGTAQRGPVLAGAWRMASMQTVAGLRALVVVQAPQSQLVPVAGKQMVVQSLGAGAHMVAQVLA
mmetsp:Transcript_11428/g.27957  ORF Transcript_11428/g.27957 Transcript_11428/m.27957 type:complete len:112 (-) Transcript_11428:61-396(-)